MEVRKICSLGYFDRLILDGYTMPMYNSRGIELHDNESLRDALENSKQHYSQRIGKLRINVIGEAFNKETYEEILNMRNYRDTKLKLKRDKLGTIDRYTIGYVDLLILKSDYSYIDQSNKEKIEDDIIKFAKIDDQSRLIIKAIETMQNIANNSNKKEECNVAIVDRVYVDKEFRKHGLSKWIHTNIGDIIKIYAMVDIRAVLLIPGDFSNEAESEFNLSKQEYVNLLIKHYKKTGYRNAGDGVLCKKIKHTPKLVKTGILKLINNV